MPAFKRPWHFRTAALLLAAVLALLLRWVAPGALGEIENLAGDLAWRVGSSSQAERRVVVVDIDEASLKEVGPWPWPRATMADLSERLNRAGAMLQVYDISFADPREGDVNLADAWARSAVVLGQVFALDEATTPESGRVAGELARNGCPPFAPMGFGAYGTAPDLLAAGPAVGHMTPRIERDGVVRELPALICRQGKSYASLGLVAMWRVVQPDGTAPGAEALKPDWTWRTASEQGLGAGLLAPAAWLESPSLPGLMVPLDGHGNLRVPFRIDRKAFASVPASRVLKGDADLSLLKGAIVLVGATAFGIGDVVATPHAAVAAGLEVHAQAIAGLLDRRIPYTPRGSDAIQGLMMAAVAGFLLAAAGRRGGSAVRRLPMAGIFAAVALWLGASTVLLRLDLWQPWALSAVFTLLAAAALAVAEHAQAVMQRERLSAHLGAYLPRPVAQRLAATDPTGNVQVEQRDVSVLVADIRNFSAFAAQRPPEEAVALLHAFSSTAVDVVERHGGVVERVAGDSILAVWNAFSACESHPEQAMAAARELLTATRPLLTASHPQTDDGTLQPLALGIGLESGTAIVGSFGPARRRAHAALGEPVSVATRVQQMTADLSVPIIAGPRLAASLQPERTESLGEYLLEGLGRHCQLFVPVAWAELVPVDPGWASAVTATDSSSETGNWTRWNQSGTLSAVSAGVLRASTRFLPRDV